MPAVLLTNLLKHPTREREATKIPLLLFYCMYIDLHWVQPQRAPTIQKALKKLERMLTRH